MNRLIQGKINNLILKSSLKFDLNRQIEECTQFVASSESFKNKENILWITFRYYV